MPTTIVFRSVVSLPHLEFSRRMAAMLRFSARCGIAKAFLRSLDVRNCRMEVCSGQRLARVHSKENPVRSIVVTIAISLKTPQ